MIRLNILNIILNLFKKKKKKSKYSDKNVMHGALYPHKPRGTYNSKRGKRKIIR